MSQILSLRVNDRVVERLERFARRQGNGMTRTKAGTLLLEEALRQSEFAYVEFRDSPIGRQPYLSGSGLAIWEVIMIARSFDFDAEELAKSYRLSFESVKAAFHFYDAYKEEIDQAIEDNNIGFDAMKRQLPGMKLVVVSDGEFAENTAS